MAKEDYKPKIIKGLIIKYGDKEYDKITSISRGYDYSSFHYLDENESECSIYLAPGQSFSMVNDTD